MTTMQAIAGYTYADYCRLPDDGKQYEVIDGVLYMAPAPNPRHQEVSAYLFLLIGPAVLAKGLGRVYYAPIDVIFADGDTFQPDLIFVSRDRLHIITRRGVEGPPELVVEVLSPSTRRRDRELKRRRYAHFGVLEYWQVDPETRTIRVLILEGGEYAERGIYGIGDELTTPLIPGLSIPVAQVFAGN